MDTLQYLNELLWSIEIVIAMESDRICFGWSPPCFVQWREVLYTLIKKFPLKLITLLRADISRLFATYVFFQKNLIRTNKNIPVLYSTKISMLWPLNSTEQGPTVVCRRIRHAFVFCCIYRVPRGRCYDNNFLRFLPIFAEKIGVFSQKSMLCSNFCKNTCNLSKKRQYFC
jgi:hypothetical protein